MSEQLPKKLYVKEVEEKDPEDNFLEATPDFTDLCECDTTVRVGVYTLEKMVGIKNKTFITD